MDEQPQTNPVADPGAMPGAPADPAAPAADPAAPAPAPAAPAPEGDTTPPPAGAPM